MAGLVFLTLHLPTLFCLPAPHLKGLRKFARAAKAPQAGGLNSSRKASSLRLEAVSPSQTRCWRSLPPRGLWGRICSRPLPLCLLVILSAPLCVQIPKPLLFCFLRFYLFIFRERGKGGRKRGRETSTYSCVLPAPTTPNLPHNPGMCPDWESNQQPLGSQTSVQSIELHQPGLISCYKETRQVPLEHTLITAF
ncbi:hypothetical protein HJG60_008315 [Phyllostomus discolor]|uniref:Uncharacterized protein n=1 Tax=Phyllostomus discolor TaxID=89673 RepID=A0A834DPE5_9CHIR|nr:hypothetical protein HJG60_008315 [Phyllostomus discolor]